MEPDKFYAHVHSWIKSYRSADALNWLRKFVENSTQPADIKEKLQKEINDKVSKLKNKPSFIAKDGKYYLSDENNHPMVYTTRFSAICKMAELKMKGYDVELSSGSVFYRIVLTTPHLLNS